MKTMLASTLVAALALAAPAATAGPDFITPSPKGGDLMASSGTSEIWPVDDVVFEHASHALSSSSVAQIESAARWLRTHGTQKLVLEGYADSSGTLAFNRELATRRAKVVRNLLLDRGVSSDRILLVIYGEAGAKPTAHPLDRRVIMWTSDLPIETLVATSFERKPPNLAMWTRNRAQFTESRDRPTQIISTR